MCQSRQERLLGRNDDGHGWLARVARSTARSTAQSTARSTAQSTNTSAEHSTASAEYSIVHSTARLAVCIKQSNVTTFVELCCADIVTLYKIIIITLSTIN